MQLKRILEAWPIGRVVVTAHEVAKKLIAKDRRWAIGGLPTLCHRVKGPVESFVSESRP